MKTPYKVITFYDLETGGLKFKKNSITEFAGVAVDNETLETIEELSVVFKPRLDLSYLTFDAKKDAKELFKDICVSNEETKIKEIEFQGEKISLKKLDLLTEAFTDFYDFLVEREKKNKKHLIFSYEQFLETKDIDECRILQPLFHQVYNPQALKVTHISIDMLLNEGVEFEEGYSLIKAFFEKHKIKNSKPILAGHNIRGFDNDFMIKLFDDNKDDFLKHINGFMIDTLDWARLKWLNIPDFTLSTCASTLNLVLKGAHRAINDTIANARVGIKLIEALRGSGEIKEKEKRKKYDFNF